MDLHNRFQAHFKELRAWYTFYDTNRQKGLLDIYSIYCICIFSSYFLHLVNFLEVLP